MPGIDGCRLDYTTIERMSHFSATTRVTLGLVCLTLTVFLSASTFGILPNKRQVLFEQRAKMCETLAINCSLFTAHEDRTRLLKGITAIAHRNPNVQSIGVRMEDGSLYADVGGHTSFWTFDPKQEDSDLQMIVPVLADNKQWGQVEVRYSSAPPRGFAGFVQSPLVQMLAFVLVAKYLLYFLYLRKMLEHLDPSKIIPERVRTTLDTLAEGLLVVDKNERIMLANRSFAKTMGLAPAELIGRKASSFGWQRPEDADKEYLFPWIRAVRNGEAQIGETLVMHGDRSHRSFKINATPIGSPDGKTRGAFVSFDDITVIEKSRAEMREMLNVLQGSRDEVRKKNDELQVLATLDPLTGCLNRRSFFEQFETHFKAAMRYKSPLSCVMLDVDHFKSVNDRYGHSMGDLVLQKVAAALQETIRECDLLGRYGGEEFCVLLPNLDLQDAARAAERYRTTLESMSISNISVTASFGVSSNGFGATGQQKLLDQADHCLYAAKRNGRNNVVSWDELPEDFKMDPVKTSESETDGSPVGDCQDETNTDKSAQCHEDLDLTIPFHAVTALTSALAYRDESTAEHSRRVADLCVAVAVDLMSVADTYVLEVAALLHDIGKIGVPDSILLKPGPLSNEEWKTMGIHDRIGVEIVGSTFASNALIEIIENHHAFYGGKGRNTELPTGDNIPLGSRILAIADAYDAMVSDRVYRKGMPQESAFAELRRCAESQFDPKLVEKFIDVVVARYENRTPEVSSVSKQTALRIGEQIERLARALDSQDLDGLAALAGRLNATATKQGVTEIAEVAANLQVAADELDVTETVRLTSELLVLCRSTQKVYLDCIEPEASVAE